MRYKRETETCRWLIKCTVSHPAIINHHSHPFSASLLCARCLLIYHLSKPSQPSFTTKHRLRAAEVEETIQIITARVRIQTPPPASQHSSGSHPRHGGLRTLTYKDEAGSLEELFIIPGWVLRLQKVAHAVVLSQPDGSVEHKPRKQPKHLLAHGHLVLGRDALWIVHQHWRLFH